MAGSRSLRAWLAALLQIERLPPPATAVRERRDGGALRALLFPEPLPLDPELPPRRRAAWLRWLFVPERLDPP